MFQLFIILCCWNLFPDLKMNKKKKWHRKKISSNKNHINISMAFDNLKFSMQLFIPKKILLILLRSTGNSLTVLDFFFYSIQKILPFPSLFVKKKKIQIHQLWLVLIPGRVRIRVVVRTLGTMVWINQKLDAWASGKWGH